MRITPQQVRQRRQALPERLRALGDQPEVENIIDKLETELQLSTNDVTTVARSIAYVTFGFLKTSELERELINEGLSPEISKKASEKLVSEIFSSLQAELDRIYAPAGSVPDLRSAPAPDMPAPAGFNEPALEISPEPAPKPIYNIGATPFTKNTPALDRQPEPLRPNPPIPASADPAPVFLRREEQGIRPLEQKNAGNRLGLGAFKYQDTKPTAAPLAAKLEIGQGAAPEKKTGPVRNEATPVKVVHYSEWLAPANKPSAAPSASSEPVPLHALNPVSRPAETRPAQAAPVAPIGNNHPAVVNNPASATPANTPAAPATAPIKPPTASRPAPPVIAPTMAQPIPSAPAPTQPAPTTGTAAPQRSVVPSIQPLQPKPAPPAVSAPAPQRPVASPASAQVPPAASSHASEVIDLTSL